MAIDSSKFLQLPPKGTDAPAVLFRNSYQTGVFSIFYAIGRHPLYLWRAQVRNGHIRRLTDEHIGSAALEVAGNNVSTCQVTCPEQDRQTLGVKLPFLVLLVKNLNKYFAFEVEVLDDQGQKRRFKASNFHSGTKVGPFNCSMPLQLEPGWNQVMFNLADFTKRAFNSNYVETTRMTIHANCRLRRIFFMDRLYDVEDGEKQPRGVARGFAAPQRGPAAPMEEETAEATPVAPLTPASTAPTESDLPRQLVKKVS
ncbi:Cilia- and flagella-associated protein 20 (Basal body up-regulated protein 22) (Bug22p) (Flagellar-associated protein 20) [Durusdinium trenchii]|uniref:Cilia- and flagella-associated protein 20 (Basal body up-regulated protein 22) (Bug22p) (Flagellar-associated protein 20) n=1 Tax=Durusdinium trenchii TaxID=1381693 RepID=A0ABP0IQ77_9DINO